MKFDWLDSLDEPSHSSFQRPDLYQWTPELSGDIDIRVDAQGRWWHEGGLIVRKAIVDIFSSILRREGDDYFLVTPVEKWRIQVEDVPFLIVDISKVGEALFVELATGHTLEIGEKHPLYRSAAGDSLYVVLSHGLVARFNRPAYYRAGEILNAQGELVSGKYTFKLVD